MENLFDKVGSYYDLIYEEKDSKSEVDYIISLLEEYGNKGKDILEFGSGTGRHGRLLAESGYKVHGVERSGSMVKAAQIIDGFTCEEGDITKVNCKKKFDNIISIFHVVSYLTENSQVKDLFNNAYKHLKKDGLFIFDVWYSPSVMSIKPETRIKRFNNKTYSIIRLAEPINFANKNIVEVKYTYMIENKLTKENLQIKENHPMRHFSIPEIQFICDETGFNLVKNEEWVSGLEPSENTWGVCLVLRRK